MPLGYKYVERDATDFVNWAEIGKNMSDMFETERKIREQKKAAIDEDSRQIGLTLANAPQGQDANARTAALKLADNATQYKNQLLKMVKSGKMKVRDYLISTQNLKDSIGQSFDALTEYQKNYGEVMDGYKNNTISKMTVDDWAKVEGFGNWNQSDFYINPTNGIVNIAMKDKKIVDGKEVYTMSENPNNFASPAYIKGLLQSKKDRLDVQKISTDWSSKLGTYIKTDAAKSFASQIMKQGQVVSVKDITKREDFRTLPSGVQQEVYNFFNAETEWINGQLSNPYARGSVLIDHVQFVPGTNKMYRRTHDKADAAAHEEAIYEEIDPSTQQGTLIFSDKQKEAANQYVRDMARSQYNIEEKVDVKSQLQLQEKGSTQRAYEEKANEAENFSRQTSYLLTGTPAQRADAVKYFTGKKANVVVDPEGKDKGVYVENASGEMIRFEPSGNPLDQGKAIIGALKTATGVDIPDEMIINKFPIFMGKAFSQPSGEIKGTVVPRDVDTEYQNKVVDKVRYTIFKKLDHNYAAPKLIEVIGNVPGVTIKPTGWNDLTITYTPKKGLPKSIKVNTNQSTDEEAKTNAEIVKKFLQEIDPEYKERAIGPETPTEEQTATPAKAAPAKKEQQTRIKGYN